MAPRLSRELHGKAYWRKEKQISRSLGSIKCKLKTCFPPLSLPDSFNESKISIVFTRETKKFSLAWIGSNLEYFSIVTYCHLTILLDFIFAQRILPDYFILSQWYHALIIFTTGTRIRYLCSLSLISLTIFQIKCDYHSFFKDFFFTDF